MLDLLLWPFVAGVVLAGIHAWYGQHVLARGVVFVDLSLAQIAALGLTVALLAGHTVQSDAGYWYALAFAAGGALLFAAARPHGEAVPQEAVIASSTRYRRRSACSCSTARPRAQSTSNSCSSARF